MNIRRRRSTRSTASAVAVPEIVILPMIVVVPLAKIFAPALASASVEYLGPEGIT